MRWLRSLAAFAAFVLLIWAEEADARFEGAFSHGASAARALMPPAVAARVPVLLVSLDHPAGGQQSGSLGGLFNRPGIGGFAAGFLGAGVFGLLFGYGLFGELGGVTSYFGLLFQLALIAMLGRLIWSWWNGRNMPAFTGLTTRQLADPYLRSRHEVPADIGTPPSDHTPPAGGPAASLAEHTSAHGRER